MSQITSPASALGPIPNGSYLTWLTAAGASHDLIRLTSADDVVINTTSGRRISLFYGGSESWRFTTSEMLHNTTAAYISLNTSDGSDNGVISLNGGGGGSATTQNRGARILAYGNENANTGSILLIPGNVAGGDIDFYSGAALLRMSLENSGNLVFDGTNGGNIIFTRDGFGVIHDVGTIAAAGSAQGDATAIANILTYVTAASGTNGVRLSAAPTAGQHYTIYNAGSSSLEIYPGSGDQINGLGTNNAVTLPAGATLVVWAISSSQWYAYTGGVPA